MAVKCRGGPSHTRTALWHVSGGAIKSLFAFPLQDSFPRQFFVDLLSFRLASGYNTMLHKGERDRDRDRARENQLAHTGARDLPQSEPSQTHRERQHPLHQKRSESFAARSRARAQARAWGRGGSRGQPGSALQRQEDRDGQRPAEDRHAAAAAAVEARLGTIEGGFTWGDLREVGVGARQPLDQDVAVLVEVWWERRRVITYFNYCVLVKSSTPVFN